MTRLLLLLCFFIGITTAQAQTWIKFTDVEGKFTTKYPDNWEKKIKENNRVFFTSPKEDESDDFRQNVNISVTYSEDLVGSKLRTLVPSVLKTIENKYDGYKFISGKYFKWNGVEAYEYNYSIKQSGLSFDAGITQWMSIREGSIYMVTYTAPVGPDDMRETALKIMRSIVF